MTQEQNTQEQLDELSELVAKLTERVLALEQEKVSKEDLDDKLIALEADHEEITRSIDALKEKLNQEEEEIEKDEQERE